MTLALFHRYTTNRPAGLARSLEGLFASTRPIYTAAIRPGTSADPFDGYELIAALERTAEGVNPTIDVDVTTDSYRLPPGAEEDLLLWLETAAQRGDEDDFLAVIDAIERKDFSPQDYARLIRLALSAGAHLKARKLAQEAAGRFPEDEELEKTARILAPPQVASAKLPPSPAVRDNHNWLKTFGGEYRGLWVALKDGALLGSAQTLQQLIAQVGNPKDRGILVTRVQ